MPDLRVSLLAERLAVSTNLSEQISAVARIPTAVTWNRVEGRPRTDDLARPMRAEVRDPLWMLSRQWQFGEFDGADSGTPVHAKLFATTTRVASYALRDQPPQPYDRSKALEPLVERQRIEPDLMMSLQIGRQWSALLSAALPANDPLLAEFIRVYAITAPLSGARDLPSLQQSAYRKELRLRMALDGRSVDGARLLADTARASDAGTLPSSAFVERGVVFAVGQEAIADATAAQLLDRWQHVSFSQPAANDDAWMPDRLEYSFSLGVPNGNRFETVLTSDQYPGGRLDWFALDVQGQQPVIGDPPIAETVVKSFVPTPVRFGGMPNARWWEFEDRRVGFGLASASKTDLVKLLLAEFGLVFSNDWFIVPFSCTVGSLIETKGIVVTDNFGFHTLVEPTARRHAALGLAGRWTMWTLTRRDALGEVDERLLLAPALARSLESAPVDEVLFLRDEMANLTWGVEVTVPDSMGGGRDGRDAGRQLRTAIALAYPPPPLDPRNEPDPDVLLAYQLMGTVPENWIPLVPVTLQGDAAATAFLQGAMPRVPPLEPRLDGAGVPILGQNVVLPRGAILARDPLAQPNVIHEEEILRGGASVRRTFQQARWSDGSTVTWTGREKRNGRGEGSSGLAFDHISAKPPVPEPAPVPANE